LHGPSKVYFPSALHIAPNSALPTPNPSSASSPPNSMVTITSEPSIEEEK